jgi:O-acetyl-ADP-ribose deacetylase (regulator of RNase III)
MTRSVGGSEAQKIMAESGNPESSRGWVNPSVVALAGTADPVAAITARARAVILEAIEQGLHGPPFDPFDLAVHLKISVVPREDIRDARTVPAGGGRVVIEFNPNRSRARVRYSIAHELAHTLFPDCVVRIRNRALRAEVQRHDAELETLCNVAAAELLMPSGSFPQLAGESLSIDHLMELRARYDVSTEALLLRVIRLAREQCLMFSASRLDDGPQAGRYRLDYAVPSRSWRPTLLTGALFKPARGVAQGPAPGFTAHGREAGPGGLGGVQVECVGIPPFPGQRYPRVVGVITPPHPHRNDTVTITYLKGDATEPRGTKSRLIAHIVNDRGLTWGAGFGLVVRRKWPPVQDEFRRWAVEHRPEFKLGAVHIGAVNDEIIICHMVAQHGYGPSPKPRLRYAALRTCLSFVAEEALRSDASVHMPRIGTGQAGGSWWIISELIDEALCQRGVRVTVYDLPGYGVSPSV